MSAASVQDLINFAALPPETQAHRLGWEACAEEITAPFLSDREAEGAVKGLLGLGRAA